MTYNAWKIRENGLKRIGINFKPSSLIYNPDVIRITNGINEANLVNTSLNQVKNNNDFEFSLFSLEDAINSTSSSRYKKLSKVFSKERRINRTIDYTYEVGIKGRSDKYYMEDCRVLDTTCLPDEGTTTKCNPSRCYGGTFSFSIENENTIKLVIDRGSISKVLFIKNKFFNKKSSEISDYYISISNNSDSLIYYQNYQPEDIKFYKSIKGKIKLPLQLLFEINGYGNFLSDFFDNILIDLFKNTCEGPIETCIRNKLLSQEVDLFRNELEYRISISLFSNFTKSEILKSIGSINDFENLNEYVSQCYYSIFEVFNSISYVVDSGFYNSRKEKFRGELRGRPVYSRLPSSNFGYNISALEQDIIFTDNLNSRFNLDKVNSGQLVVLNDRSEGYKYVPRFISSHDERIKFGLPLKITDQYDPEQIYSAKDPDSWIKLIDIELPPVPVTEWVLEGTDELLIESKEKIDRFFSEYLDPDTCFSESLDWLAQHVGLNDGIYNSALNEKIKRILIKNALGWYDSNLSFTVNFPDGTSKVYRTIKGKVLEDEPFNNSQWSDSSFTSNKLILSKTLYGSKTYDMGGNITLISNKDSQDQILFENTLNFETRKLISSDGSYLIFDDEFFKNEVIPYRYFLVRFYGELLPDGISRTDKYILFRSNTNKYEIYSEFGSKIFISEFLATSDIYAENLFKIRSSDINNFIYDKNLWEGIYQNKGSRIGLAFALSLPSTKTKEFVHSHVLEEIKGKREAITVNNTQVIREVYSVKSGLREYEFESKSPLLRPWERPYLQVGDEALNFDNQLVADISEVKEENESYDLVFRLPFYYNFNGRTWRYVLSVKENWIPANINSRVQYPYLASELWSVGDAFFELEIDG